MARPCKSNEIMNTQYTSKKVRTPKKKMYSMDENFLCLHARTGYRYAANV